MTIREQCGIMCDSTFASCISRDIMPINISRTEFMGGESEKNLSDQVWARRQKGSEQLAKEFNHVGHISPLKVSLSKINCFRIMYLRASTNLVRPSTPSPCSHITHGQVLLYQPGEEVFLMEHSNSLVTMFFQLRC